MHNCSYVLANAPNGTLPLCVSFMDWFPIVTMLLIGCFAFLVLLKIDEGKKDGK